VAAQVEKLDLAEAVKDHSMSRLLTGVMRFILKGNVRVFAVMNRGR